MPKKLKLSDEVLAIVKEHSPKAWRGGLMSVEEASAREATCQILRQLRKALKQHRGQEPVWQTPDTAPKNGMLILGDFGWPWACSAVWDEYDEQWVLCMLAVCPMADGPDNSYLETDTAPHKDLKAWMPMPTPPRRV